MNQLRFNFCPNQMLEVVEKAGRYFVGDESFNTQTKADCYISGINAGLFPAPAPAPVVAPAKQLIKRAKTKSIKLKQKIKQLCFNFYHQVSHQNTAPWDCDCTKNYINSENINVGRKYLGKEHTIISALSESDLAIVDIDTNQSSYAKTAEILATALADHADIDANAPRSLQIFLADTILLDVRSAGFVLIDARHPEKHLALRDPSLELNEYARYDKAINDKANKIIVAMINLDSPQ